MPNIKTQNKDNVCTEEPKIRSRIFFKENFNEDEPVLKK